MEMIYVEKVDIVLFKKILNNFDVLFESGKLGRFVDSNYKVIENKESIKTIVKKMYLNKIKTNNISYKYVGKETTGRLYSKTPSLQGISRVIRHSIARDIYYDIDMNNAHPVILRYYCETNNISCPNLIYYNDNRNECFKSLTDKFDISREEAKKIPLTSINGGFIRDDCPEWMLSLHNELIEIRKKVCELNPILVRRATINYDNKLKARNTTIENAKYKPRNKPLFKNIEGSACNYMLCNYENTILQCCLKKIKKLGFEVGALVFDGFMLYKEGIENIHNIITILEQEIINTLNINIKLSVKEMDEGLSLDEFEIDSVPIDEFDGIVRLDNFVCPSIFNTSPITLIRAGLGRGKSTASISHINTTHYDKVFILTPRKTYAQSIVNRFNAESRYTFELYSEIDYEIKGPTYIVVQCESLHRLTNYSFDSLCVILDETESFLTQLTSTKTHKSNHLDNIKIFECLISSSTKVIGMDAFLSPKSFNVFKNLKLNYNYYNYIKPLEQRKHHSIPLKTFFNPQGKVKKLYFESFSEYVVNKINSGKKMYVFISSVKKMNELKNIILNTLPHIKLGCYSSNAKDSLINVNQYWSSLDVILTTSSITVGVNFDVPNHFHSIAVYLSSTSKNLIRDIFQSTYRVRHLIDNILYFVLDPNHFGICEPTLKNVIKKGLYEKQNSIIKQFETYKLSDSSLDQSDLNELLTPIYWLENLYIDNIHEYNLSIMNTETVFMDYLKECNYVKLEQDEEPEIEEVELITEEVITILYNDIPSITSDTMKHMRKQPIKTELEIAQIDKFFFQQTLENVEPEKEILYWDLYNNNGRSKCRNLAYEKGLKLKVINMVDIISKKHPTIADKLSLQSEVITNLNQWYNIESTHDINTSISSEQLKTLVPLFTENITKIYNAFDLRDSRSKKDTYDTKDIIRITNQVYSKWCYSKIERTGRTKKTVEGKRVDIASFNIVEETGIYDKIKPKRRYKTKSPTNKKLL